MEIFITIKHVIKFIVTKALHTEALCNSLFILFFDVLRFCNRFIIHKFSYYQATRHAEMEAIDVLLGQWQKNGLSMAEVAEKFLNCSLYVTCEPCIMCASALSILGMLLLVFS